MEIIFWLSIGLVGFVYFGYPVIIYLIAKYWGKKPLKEEITPSVSLIIPFYNEEMVVKDKVENAFYLDYPKDRLEIIFCLDGCTDRTKDILKMYNDPRIKILDFKERMGKVATLNRAVPFAKGEILVFSDANSIHRYNTLREIVASFADKEVGCVSGKLTYEVADLTSVSKGENMYWKYDNFIKRQESRLGKLLITNGSIQAVRKELYPFPDTEIADDLSIPIMIQAQGQKVVYEPRAVVYEAATQSIKEELNQKVRIISQGLKGVVRLRKYLFNLGPLGLFEFVFHKMLRWSVAVLMIIIFILNLMLLKNYFYFNLFVLQVIFYLLAYVGFKLRKKSKIKIFYVPFYFCLVNFAVLVALHRFLRQEQTRMWDKAHSTRVNKANV